MKVNKLNLLLLAVLLFPLFGQSVHAQEAADNRIEDIMPERAAGSSDKFYRKLEQADIDYFNNGAADLISEYRASHNGALDLVAIRPFVDRSLHDYKDFSYFTQAEFLTFKGRYDKLIDTANKQKMADDAKDAALKDLIKITIEEIAKNPLERKAANTLCHSNYECGQGLNCVAIPARAATKLSAVLSGAQIDASKCLASGAPSTDFKQCCSGELTDSYGKSVCAEVKACSATVVQGSSCFDNENCAQGTECVQKASFNCGVQSFSSLMGLALPEGFKVQGASCSKNSECASNSCLNGICEEVFTCLPACVGSQGIPSRGKKCCPGLLEENVGGKVMCVPNCPPMGAFMGTPKSQKKEVRSAFIDFLSLISPISIAKADSTTTDFTNQIKANKDKYSPGNINREVQKAEEDIMKKATTYSAEGRKTKTIAAVPAFSLREGSDFETCHIDFRADHYIYLQNKSDKAKKLAKGKLFDIEMALLGFEFVALGSGVQDYWVGEDGNSMHSRVKAVAEKHRDFRHAYLEDLKTVNKEVRCLCLDKNGYEKISADDQTWFREYCPDEYSAYETLKQQLVEKEVETNEYDGDASGVKYKRMLVAWTAANKKFADILYSGNNVNLAGLNDLANWSRTNNWYEVETKQYDIFNFTVKNPGAVASGVLVGVMLAAAVVAVVSGMAMGPTITLWASLGIISASGVAGGVGMWLVGALKGAWVAQGPEVYDDHIKGPYKCGKKDQCSDYKRVLNQPYNNVCKTHTGANACVKSFLVYKDVNEGAVTQNILVDPFVPLNVEKDLLIKDKRSYATLMDQGFQNALKAMRSKKPSGEQNTSYFDKTFIDSEVIGYYTPPIAETYEQTYILNQDQIGKIKTAARNYMIEEGYFAGEDNENLEKFADYVMKFHFVWPRTSLADRIAYPLPGFQTYLEMVASMLDVVTLDNGDNIAGYTDLNENYVTDYLHTISNVGTATRLSQAGAEGIAKEPSDLVQEDVDAIENSFAKSAALFKNNNKTGISSGGNLADIGTNTTDAAGSGLLSEVSDEVKSAIAANKQARAEKESRLAAFKKKNGDDVRANALLGLKNQMMDAMTSPTSGSKAASSGLASNSFGAGLLNKDSGNGKAAIADKDKTGDDGKSSIDWSDVYKGNAPKGGSGYNGVDYGAQYNSANAGSAAGGGRENQALFEAVQARDEGSKKSYQGNEGDSLFEKITKAYIRNYDRVLRRLPSKD